MKELETFQEYIAQLRAAQWKPLFDLIPEIEETDDFGRVTGGNMVSGGLLHMPHWKPTPVVRKFLKVLQDLQIVPVFEWTEWAEGKKIIAEHAAAISHFDIENSCKLFTIIIREDRLRDGFLGDCFENGTILRIIKHLKSLVAE